VWLSGRFISCLRLRKRPKSTILGSGIALLHRITSSTSARTVAVERSEHIAHALQVDGCACNDSLACLNSGFGGLNDKGRFSFFLGIFCNNT